MGLHFTEAQIKQLAIHRVGNLQREEGYFLSKQTTDLRDTDAHDLLLQFFTGVFKTPEFYQFTHPTGLENSDLNNLSAGVFSKKKKFLEASQELAKLLYSKSDHPKVLSGELYVTYFTDVVYDGEVTDALGIFKSESKTPFMKVLHKGDVYDCEFDEGINLHMIDKACIILNTGADDGYRVCIHDRQAKNDEALYWKHEFLGLKPCADNYHKTRQFMSLCKDYIKEQLPQEFEVQKTEQIDLMNKSAAFFKNNDKFDYQTFTNEVMEAPLLRESFGKFKEEYEERYEFNMGDGFDISESAVKSQSRVFKSVLKLDRNFHIYVHGNKEMIERGYDEERRLNYYKVYFMEEK